MRPPAPLGGPAACLFLVALLRLRGFAKAACGRGGTAVSGKGRALASPPTTAGETHHARRAGTSRPHARRIAGEGAGGGGAPALAGPMRGQSPARRRGVRRPATHGRAGGGAAARHPGGRAAAAPPRPPAGRGSRRPPRGGVTADNCRRNAPRPPRRHFPAPCEENRRGRGGRRVRRHLPAPCEDNRRRDGGACVDRRFTAVGGATAGRPPPPPGRSLPLAPGRSCRSAVPAGCAHLQSAPRGCFRRLGCGLRKTMVHIMLRD